MIPRTFSCVLILVLASAPGFAQSPGNAATSTVTAAVATATAVPAIPKDPKDLMLLAAKVNGLASMGSKPWYVMADFQTFDPDGKPKDKGTFEEWWAGPEKYKISYQSSGFNQVLYHDGGKSLVTGDTGLAPLPQHMVEQYLFSPLPSKSEIEKLDYLEKDSKLGKVRLKCIGERVKPEWSGSSSCFSEDTPMIRAESADGGLGVVFNSIVESGGHYIAKQVDVQDSGLPIVSLNVTALEFPSHIEDSVFGPPSSAVAAPALWSESGMTGGNRISGDDPDYPRIARDQRIQGQVILSAHINKVGDIDDLQVVSGPITLRQASIDAVKTWKFKPYVLKGKLVEVGAQIDVSYALGPLL
jgi:TonB family protein